jgi:hypothetical protein
MPDAPERVTSGFPFHALSNIALAHRPAPGDVRIRKNNKGIRIEIDGGDLQPGRPVRSDRFYVAIAASGEYSLHGRVFADNLPAPADFILTIAADIRRTEMTVEELEALPEPPRARW